MLKTKQTSIAVLVGSVLAGFATHYVDNTQPITSNKDQLNDIQKTLINEKVLISEISKDVDQISKETKQTSLDVAEIKGEIKQLEKTVYK